MSNEFFVEGRYFPNSLQAFTFAGIQADRMDRAVEVHTQSELNRHLQIHDPSRLRLSTWHATAHPSNFVRRHLVTES